MIDNEEFQETEGPSLSYVTGYIDGLNTAANYLISRAEEVSSPALAYGNGYIDGLNTAANYLKGKAKEIEARNSPTSDIMGRIFREQAENIENLDQTTR